LDTLNDILNNPSLTKSRELFNRASVNYNKGFYEEARDDLLDALSSNKTDYISWFLLGKTYLFGAGEFSTVIDLDAAVDALKNAVKFITPDARMQEEARVMAAEMCFYLGLARQTRAMDMLHTQNKTDYLSYLEQAGEAYSQSWDYSAKMLEARYNLARCKTLLGDVQGALIDLETAVRQDRNYCIKVCADNDFLSIKEQFADLIKKLKKEAYIPAKNDYDRITVLLSKLSSLGGTTNVTLPSSFTGELLYFDILDYTEYFSQVIPILLKDLADREAAIAHVERNERQAKERADQAERERQEKVKAEQERIEQGRIIRDRRAEHGKREWERIEQQNKWELEGLCRNCGGELGFFSKKCKSCGKKN
jgi:tetratricopeptide (TPR) repeat protein